jgi:hypothetical protein
VIAPPPLCAGGAIVGSAEPIVINPLHPQASAADGVGIGIGRYLITEKRLEMIISINFSDE